MKKSQRHTISLFLIAIYLFAVFSPVAPFVMQSTTGECSGDCSADGCSLERSAAHTCCCWQKKKRVSNLSQQKFNADCCATKQSKTAPILTTPGGSCCPSRYGYSGKGYIESASTSSTAPQKTRTATISTGTCGSNKLFTTGTSDNTPHLPCFFAGVTPSPRQSTLTFIPPNRLASLHGTSPEPPPKIA